MSSEMICDLAMSSVLGLRPYTPGKPVEELERELGIHNAVKLASNENPLGPPPSVLDAIQAALPELSRYPDANGFALKARLATEFDVDPSQLVLGNGSNDVLDMIARCFLGPGRNAVFSEHAFLVYPIVAQAVGASVRIARARDYGNDLDALAAQIDADTRVVFIANPNNPTGTWLGADALRKFIDALPEQVIVVIDEAYHEYVEAGDYSSAIRWVNDCPRLIVTRTFSKAYGLAGLRLGYSVSHPMTADLMNRVRHPFNSNSLALTAALTAFDDADYLAASRKLNRKGMKQLTAALTKAGFDYIPSQGNFLSIDLRREAMPVYQALLNVGVIVRPVANYGMPNHLRVSIGTKEENQRFLDAFADVRPGNADD